MAIKIGNKEYNSYEEQILENKKEIQKLKEDVETLEHKDNADYTGIVRYIEVPLELGFRFERDVEYLMTHTGIGSSGGYAALQGKFHYGNDEPFDMSNVYWIGGTTKIFKWVASEEGYNNKIVFTSTVGQVSGATYTAAYGEVERTFNSYGNNPLDYIEISYFQEGQRLFIVDRSGL